MAALLQSYPQQSSSISILQTRPSSSSGMLPTSSQNQISHHAGNNNHTQRNGFQSISGGITLSNYHGQSLVASIAPYAFTSTPDLNIPNQSISSNAVSRTDTKAKDTSNSPNLLQNQTSNETQNAAETSVSMTSLSMTSSTNLSSGSKIQSTQESTAVKTIQSSHAASASLNSSSSPINSINQTSKSSFGRYRRTQAQNTDTSSTLNSVGPQPINNNINKIEPESICSFKDFSLQMPDLSELTADLTLEVKQARSSFQEPQRYRRRSLQNNNSPGPVPNPLQSLSSSARPYSSHRRDDSRESSSSAKSNCSKISQAKLEESPNLKGKTTKSYTSSSFSPVEKARVKPDLSDSVKIPPRASSTDAVRRLTNPSPLSKPFISSPEPPATKNSFASTVNAALQHPTPPLPQAVNGNVGSQAAAQLTALNKKDVKRGKNFRLRRAFSFGSAAELLNSNNSNRGGSGNGPGINLHAQKEIFPDDLDEEQTRIAELQEAAGIGSGIYTGQGNVFTGSTDNVSISSTASSASIMIRKMGKGMKKSTRSFVGLFRPKHAAGASVTDASILPSETHVSMVNVEAERQTKFQKVPLTLDNTILELPRLGKTTFESEINFLGTERLGSSGTDKSATRKSIAGGDKDRADALAAVKKGILKRSGMVSDNSPNAASTLDPNTTTIPLPRIVTGSDSPNSTAPSTPNDDTQGHRRTASGTFGSDDYFASAVRLHGASKSHPGTPVSSGVKRNTTFSPRIQFHDTWPSGEYDRRGEIATCNRLTPMLAQQIKEELNTFKMEMEVHENSKIYTHFF